jgi:ribosomal-protein-alanine N-acetyltransferase
MSANTTSDERDMPELLAIEEDSFEHPWTENDFIDCLRERNVIGMVAEHENRVVGYMLYELWKTRINLLNFAVIPDHRRRGVGTQMISKLLGKLDPKRRNKLLVEVSEYLTRAHLFFAAVGGRAYRVVRGGCVTGEDSYRFGWRVR